MSGRTLRIREAGLGIGLLLLAVAIAIPTANMTVGFGYDRLGPRAFPYMIAMLVGISGVCVLLGVFGKSWSRAEPGESRNWIAVSMISAGLLFQMLFVKTLGWIPVATLAFAVVALAFGERRMLLNLAFGFALGCATFVLFNYGLGLHLPVGTLAEKLF